MPTIKIVRGDFKGELTLQCNGVDVQLPDTSSQSFEVDLPAGRCLLDTGPHIGGSSISFVVDQSNAISQVAPAEAASAQSNMLTLNLIDFMICAGNYVGNFRTSLNGSTQIDASTSHHFKTHAVVGLQFYIGNLAAVGGSVFYAKSDVSGNIDTTNHDAAKCFQGGVAFITTEVYFGAVNNETLKISGEISVTQPGKFQVIRGLVTHLITGELSAFYFVPQ